MAAEPARKHFTIAEYYRMGEAGIIAPEDRVELIEGEVIEMPPIGSRHASYVRRLTHLFEQLLGDRVIVSGQNPVEVGETSEPVPDLALLKPRSDFYAKEHPRADDVLLVVEVSDATLRFDERVKAPLYARAGIREMWIVDLQHARVETYWDPTPSGYTSHAALEKNERTTLQAFPDVAVAAEQILG